MNRFLIAAITLVALTAAAQAEIICTNRGCYETGMRIYRNGSGYVGLPGIHHRDDGRPKNKCEYAGISGKPEMKLRL